MYGRFNIRAIIMIYISQVCIQMEGFNMRAMIMMYINHRYGYKLKQSQASPVKTKHPKYTGFL